MQLRSVWRGIAAVGMLLWLGIGCAASTSIVGNWQTRSDESGEPNSMIQIWRSHGEYFGKIAKIYSMQRAKPLERCTKCKGELYNRPILGLVIINHARASNGKYVGGTILDPRSGKEYHCVLQTINNGTQLKVRGYLGVSLFGQTKIWDRL